MRKAGLWKNDGGKFCLAITPPTIELIDGEVCAYVILEAHQAKELLRLLIRNLEESVLVNQGGL